MGKIVLQTIIRSIVIVFAVWFSKSFIPLNFWWIVTIAGIGLGIIYPAIIQTIRFYEKNKDITDSTLCASCRHFDKSAILCIRHDEHPTLDYVPCEGSAWEPKSPSDNYGD